MDVRIIAATHQDLEALMRQGRFREDLFYRLNVLRDPLPPLRDRAEDIPELALHFLRFYSQRMNKQVASIDDDALVRLKAYPWPGNIRQLENVIQHAVVVAEKPLVTIDELPAELHGDPFPAAAADLSTGRRTGGSFPGCGNVRWTKRSARPAEHWSPLLASPASPSGIVAPPGLTVGDSERTSGTRAARARNCLFAPSPRPQATRPRPPARSAWLAAPSSAASNVWD